MHRSWKAQEEKVALADLDVEVAQEEKVALADLDVEVEVMVVSAKAALAHRGIQLAA